MCLLLVVVVVLFFLGYLYEIEYEVQMKSFGFTDM